MSAMIFVNMECFTFFPTFEQTTKFCHISSSWKPSKIRWTRAPDITLVSLSLRCRSPVEISSKLQKARDWGLNNVNGQVLSDPITLLGSRGTVSNSKSPKSPDWKLQTIEDCDLPHRLWEVQEPQTSCSQHPCVQLGVKMHHCLPQHPTSAECPSPSNSHV